MAKQTIDLGTLGGADGTGDSIRTAGAKINNNFTELYATSAVQSHIGIVQNNISSTLSNADIVLKPAGTGSILFPALRFNDNNIEAVRSNEDSINFRPNGTGKVNIGSITFDQNTISTNQSNADLELSGSGTGYTQVQVSLNIDENIDIRDNEIKTTTSDSDIVLTASGTGSVQVTSIDMIEGTVDNTVIGSSIETAGTFTTINTDSLSTTGTTFVDNTISTNQSNADLEFEASGTGYIKINGVTLPHVDGASGQVLRTDGAGQLDWFTSPILFDQSNLDDGTATVLGSSSSAQVVDTWDAGTYRSVKYHLQISDATADRYRLIDANVTHDGITAYISVFGGVDNGDGDGSSVYDTIEFSADISGGNVRLLGTVNNTNDQVIKLVRRPIKA